MRYLQYFKLNDNSMIIPLNTDQDAPLKAEYNLTTKYT